MQIHFKKQEPHETQHIKATSPSQMDSHRQQNYYAKGWLSSVKVKGIGLRTQWFSV